MGSIKGIREKPRTTLNTLLYKDDQMILKDSDDAFQQAIYTLNQHAAQYNLRIFIDKTNMMAFKGKNALHSRKQLLTTRCYERHTISNTWTVILFMNLTKTSRKMLYRLQAICRNIK